MNSLDLSQLQLVSTKAPAVPPPPVPVRVSMSENAPKLVPPPPVPPLGSTSDRHCLIPGYEEDEQRRTKLKLTLLSRLIAETKTSGSSSRMHEPFHAVHTSVSMSKNAPKLVPPPGFSPPPVPVRVSMSKSAPKLVPPPGFPPPPVAVRVSMSKMCQS
ncbi:hypothetical protein T459_00306 [Capsicum annuum]|uniref:Uncharacterized protein n=1 Tax=Capsicum annuum TaxID=4072 RepID=A0A2G3ADX1_CAPAN|nr:hypothetical protein T459_00306 [Capsicum annuum]